MDNLFNHEDKAKKTADRGPISEWNDVLQTEWYYFDWRLHFRAAEMPKKKKKRNQLGLLRESQTLFNTGQFDI